MRLVPIKYVESGMILAKNIYRGEDRQILLRANTVLKDSYIQRIKTLNYRYLYIRTSDETEEDEILEPVKETTRYKAVEILKTTINQVEKGKTVNIKEIKNVVKEMIDHILGDSRVVFNIIDLNSHDHYTYTHSINVTVLAIMIGSIMGVSRHELEVLGIGAMMHDIGKITIDPQIINKPNSLDRDEFETIKTHTRNGYEILKNKIPISFLPAHMALQHHEREDGSGYPRGLDGKSIHRFAKIVAVADVYDAITSNRAYRKALPSYIGVQEIISNTGIKYDETVVENFTKIVAPYPIGAILLLDNNQKVVVTNVLRNKCMVKPLEETNGIGPFDLYQAKQLRVVECLFNPAIDGFH